MTEHDASQNWFSVQSAFKVRPLACIATIFDFTGLFNFTMKSERISEHGMHRQRNRGGSYCSELFRWYSCERNIQSCAQLLQTEAQRLFHRWLYSHLLSSWSGFRSDFADSTSCVPESHVAVAARVRSIAPILIWTKTRTACFLRRSLEASVLVC